MSIDLCRLPWGVRIFGICIISGLLVHVFQHFLDGLPLLGILGLIKCQDLGIGLELFFAFSNGDLSHVCHYLFSQRCCHLVCCSKSQLPTSDKSFGYVQSFVCRCFGFSCVEHFHFLDVFSLRSLSTSTWKIPFFVFLTFCWVALAAITSSIRKGENLAR